VALPCKDLQARLLAEIPPHGGSADQKADSSAELARHVAECVECATVQQRALTSARLLGELSRVAAPEVLGDAVRRGLATEGREARAVAALGGLERMDAPSSLAGSVVCAIHAGHRQDRAAASLVALARRSAPNELEERLLDEPRRQSAPDVLDRLVAEELADPAKAMASRFAGRLPRLQAPAALDRYVESALRGQPGQGSQDQGSQDQGSRGQARVPARIPVIGLRRFGPLAAAAGLLAVLWVGRALLVEPGPRTDISFMVRHAESIDDLGPTARTWMTGLAGGVLDAGGPR